MSSSSDAVTLTLGTIVQVSKDTIKPGGWTCEWNVAPDLKTEPCRIVLNSWMSYYLHLSKHVKDNLTSGGAVKCRMPRCNMLSGGTTYNTLLTHIQDSHMRNVHLPCPFRRCSGLTFTRVTSLEKHFIDDHADSTGKTFSYPSAHLLPSRVPFQPMSLNLPPLPYKLTTQGSAIIPPVPGTARKGAKSQHALRAESSLTSLPPTPGKRRPRMEDRDTHPAKADPNRMHVDRAESPPRSPTIQFADLPQRDREWHDNAFGPDAREFFSDQFSVQPTRNPWVDLGRPQDIIDLTLPQFVPRPPPASILYDAFVVLNNLQDVGNEDEDEPESELTSLPPTQSDATVTTGKNQ